MNLDELKKEARSKKTAPARLEQLARHSDSSIQLAVANNPNTPAAGLEYLGGHGKYNILKAIAKNPNSPTKVLERLATHKQPKVRYALIHNPNLPPKALEWLAGDKQINLYELAMAQQNNLILATGAIETLVASKENFARLGAATFAPLTETQFERLFNDPFHSVSASLSHNRHLSQSQLKKVKSHPNPLVRAETIQLNQPDTLELDILANDSSPIVRAAVAKAINVDALTLYRLTQDSDPSVRTAVASRFSKTPKVNAAKLLHDTHPMVRAALAGRCDEPEILQKLANDDDERVRLMVAFNFYTPLDVLRKLCQDPSKSDFEISFSGKAPAKKFTIAQQATLHIRQKTDAHISEGFAYPGLDTLFLGQLVTLFSEQIDKSA